MHNLKNKLMDALYEYEDKAKNSDGRISETEIQKIHVLTDTVKNIDKIEMLEGGEGYSGESEWMGEGRIYGNSYGDGGSSYTRGRSTRRGYGNSYRMPVYHGGYSRGDGKDEMTRKLREMISEAQSEDEREAIRACIRKIEEM